MTKQGDIVFTPEWVARDMVNFFQPSGIILDPCKGSGVFLRFLPSGTKWCEQSEGKDFFTWSSPVDWVVSNPPYSKTREWFRHSYRIAQNLLYLVPIRNVFSGHGFIVEIYRFGGIRHLRFYGTGNGLGFPMGNAIAAFHIERGYKGDISTSFAPRSEFSLQLEDDREITTKERHGALSAFH